MSHKAHAIIVAAGAGTRLGAGKPKALVLLKGRPLVGYSLRVFDAHRQIEGVVLVVPEGHESRFRAIARRYSKVYAVVPGGATRADSVRAGLSGLSGNAKVVMVHDAARPFVDAAMIDRLMTAMRAHRAAIAGVPVTSTIKMVHEGQVTKTPPRECLWEAQTPQAFDVALLRKAHAAAGASAATDDSMLVERLKVPVAMVAGDRANIKVTTAHDLAAARALGGDL